MGLATLHYFLLSPICMSFNLPLLVCLATFPYLYVLQPSSICPCVCNFPLFVCLATAPICMSCNLPLFVCLATVPHLSVHVFEGFLFATFHYPLFVCLATFPYLSVLEPSPICMSCTIEIGEN